MTYSDKQIPWIKTLIIDWELPFIKEEEDTPTQLKQRILI
jgi:hypothetical protein